MFFQFTHFFTLLVKHLVFFEFIASPKDFSCSFCVALNKGDFLARGALAEAKTKGPARRLAWFTAPPEPTLHGGEVLLAGERVIGRITSGGFGHTVGRNIFCAYVAVSEPADTELSIEVMGQRYPALRHTRPPYDPERSAILA